MQASSNAMDAARQMQVNPKNRSEDAWCSGSAFAF
jgi:hypothetical protein